MTELWSRQFPSWRRLGVVLVLLVVVGCGDFGVRWWLVLLPASLALLALEWPQWQSVVSRAVGIDRGWYEFGLVAWDHGWKRKALGYFVRMRSVIVVLGTLMAHSVVFAALAYVFGMAVGQLLGMAQGGVG